MTQRPHLRPATHRPTYPSTGSNGCTMTSYATKLLASSSVCHTAKPVTWCHRMVITRKHDGSPRRTVDLSPLNKFCQRETFAMESPFQLARRIPKDTWKTVTDAWNGYHGVPLRDSDRHLTTFITPFGRWPYTRAPQGFLSSGDRYNRRFDAVLAEFERKERCVEDTVHYDTDLTTLVEDHRLPYACRQGLCSTLTSSSSLRKA